PPPSPPPSFEALSSSASPQATKTNDNMNNKPIVSNQFFFIAISPFVFYKLPIKISLNCHNFKCFSNYQVLSTILLIIISRARNLSIHDFLIKTEREFSYAFVFSLAYHSFRLLRQPLLLSFLVV